MVVFVPDRFARMDEDRSVQHEVAPTIDQREAVGLFAQRCPLLLAVLLLSSIGQAIGELQQMAWRVPTELLGGPQPATGATAGEALCQPSPQRRWYEAMISRTSKLMESRDAADEAQQLKPPCAGAALWAIVVP
ncbi:hypothetical protein [Micromonospora sp. MA102]|uniref:hypothetical protein n=1 Tax=Micromonospora sp. MA102 TaxID=2952755 RepID=UPI0021CA90F6|nr:hypothetical protein [Micromonospora sp. MA102]